MYNDRFSEVFLSISDALIAGSQIIKEDGTIDENSIDEAIEAGKTVITETKDVIIEIRPKPKPKIAAIRPIKPRG